MPFRENLVALLHKI